METYVVLRRGGWSTAAEFCAAAARTTAAGDQMPDDLACDPAPITARVNTDDELGLLADTFLRTRERT